jgi:hypothetical protein
MIAQAPSMSLGDLQSGSKWVWAYCEGIGCGHRMPLAVAPFGIRWGSRAGRAI